MLYITTRNNKDAFTAHHALTSDLASDGGRYVPFRLPVYSREELSSMKDKSFNEIVADFLNLFFSARLTGWDVDFTIGKSAARLVPMSHRIVMSELWHNPRNTYSYMVDHIYGRLVQEKSVPAVATDWVKIAVRIAVLFGVYTQLLREGLARTEQSIDISVPVGDFSVPAAALYAKRMGLPISTIICTGEDNSAIWDLIHRGSFNTADVSPELTGGLERLLQLTLGDSEVLRLRSAFESNRSYSVPEDKLSVLSSDLFCVVTGKNRAEATINSVFRSCSYIIAPQTALCYAGLQDYRAKTGVNNLTLLLADNNPLDCAAVISDATGVPAQKLREYVISPKE